MQQGHDAATARHTH